MSTLLAIKHKIAESKSADLAFYYLLFFLSGFPALFYQIVWQRALFTLYGVNVESVTIIVTVFMLGLGLGSLAGGRLSTLQRIRPLLAFGCIEVLIGLFGSASLWIFHRVGSLTAGHSTIVTGLFVFALLLIPTLLMGSTLPLLAEHLVRATGNVGNAVGSLYSVNTFGSALACFAAALFLMRKLGEAGTVDLACCFNITVGLFAIAMAFRQTASLRTIEPAAPPDDSPTAPLLISLVLAAVIGFIALAYEIIWYRLYSFVSGGKAACFAFLLGFYLLGVAYGSMAVRDACKKKLAHDTERTLRTASVVVMLGTIAAFLLGPALARVVTLIPYKPTFVFVFIASALLGSSFPLLAHAAIGANQSAGKNISYLYLSNIIGSTLGSFLIGFVVLDHWSTQAASTSLLCLGFMAYLALAFLSKPGNKIIGAACIAFLLLAFGSRKIYSDLYVRLLARDNYAPGLRFDDFVENRSGEIAVQDGTVYGGGVYDGRFNTDLIHDTNGIFRTFAIAGLHPHPTNMLVIGLSSGSWAQVVANNPEVKDITIVEINPGYLQLIRKHKDVESLLRNPKVHIVIDDGRRWVVSHPERKFDFILMNTSFYWRANASNLLSREFLMLIRGHLNPGGIGYYNTTWSEEAMTTAMSVYPYSLRVSSFMAVSDSPFDLDKERWRKALTNYAIDGHRVFDLSLPLDQRRLEEVLSVANESSGSHGHSESRTHMMQRLAGTPIITDDNMGTEWR